VPLPRVSDLPAPAGSSAGQAQPEASTKQGQGRTAARQEAELAMSRCTEYVPTVVEIRSGLTDEGPRHIVSSAGPAGVWTLCGQWFAVRRLRILKVDRKAGTMRVRDEEQRIESWAWWDCHRTCALEHLRRKRNYRIGTGWWSWLWHPETEPAPVLTVEEAKQRLAALEAPLNAPRLRWWRRWFGRAA
jgi:hypothetical protein